MAACGRAIPWLGLGIAGVVNAAPWSEDFEAMTPGAPPTGWSVVGAVAGDKWAIRVATDSAATGSHCFELAPATESLGRGAGAVLRLDARPYRGKTVRFCTQARYRPVPSQDGWAQVRIGAARGDGVVVAQDAGGDRRVRGPGWTRIVVALAVPGDTDTLAVGLNVNGGGIAWIDALTLEENALDLGRWNSPPAALSARGIDNVIALARLYGYVRFFHPSDEASATDWNLFLLDAIRRVEQASNPAALREALQAVFAPVAPTLALGTEAPPAVDIGLPPGGSEREFVYWHHFGYGIESVGPNIYESRRVGPGDRDSLASGAAAPGPGAVAAGDLGGGVAFRMPLVLYVQEGRTWPRATAPRAGLDVPEEWRPTAADRTTRLVGVIVAWNVFQHFYPYFDVVSVDWNAELRTALKAAATDPDQRSYLRTLRRLTAKLQDGHVRVWGDVDDKPYTLPLAWEWAEGKLVVTATPSSTSGDADAPRRGDVVEALDGTKITDLVAKTLPEISAATAGWANNRLQGQLLRRDSTQPVRLDLRDVQGRRRKVVLSPVIASWANRTREARPANGSEVAPGVVYFDLCGAAKESLEAALPQLSAARRVVLDMRGYPGRAGAAILAYLAREPMASAFWNVAHIRWPNRQGMVFETRSRWDVRPREPHIPAPGGSVVFLTDGRAISYAESCMGIVEAYKLGVIVGDTTAGTNGNVAQIQLPGGFHIGFTSMQVIKHDGSRHHGVGIRATVPAARTQRGIADGRDEVLEKAIAVANGS